MENSPDPQRETQETTQAAELPNTPEGSVSPRSVSALSTIIVTEPATSSVTTSQTSQSTPNTPDRGWSYRYDSCRNDSCKGFIKTALYPGGSLVNIAEATSNDNLLCVWIGNLIYSRFFALLACGLYLTGNPGYPNFLIAVAVFYILRWAVASTIRERLRLYFDIGGTKCEDCALSLCCERFVIHQISEELEYRKTQTGNSHFNIPMNICNKCHVIHIWVTDKEQPEKPSCNIWWLSGKVHTAQKWKLRYILRRDFYQPATNTFTFSYSIQQKQPLSRSYSC